LSINIGLALIWPAVCGNDNNFGFRGATFNQGNPIVNKTLLWPFPGFPNNEINGGSREKELMGGTIDGLAAKIPSIEGNLGCVMF
jgi:hypothetical protein